MTTIGEAIIEVHGDTSRLESDIKRGTSPSKMGKLGSVAGKGLALGFTAAAGALVAGGAFLKGAFDEAEDAKKVGAITANAIKATGGAANVSAKQVEALSGAISAKAGIDDEAIQSGANLLLTFKNVRNEVGKGSAIFDRATKSAVDLSAAGFGSIEGGSKMLGKALNDPIAGISALGRAGVTFSADQKAMIAKMVEGGDVLGAQKIILGEVESQVGGAAEAQATAADKMGVAWGNLKETVGTALMPVFEKVMTFVTTKVIPGLEATGPAFTAIGAAVGPIVSVVGGFFSSLGGSGEGGAGKLSTQIATLKETFTTVFESVKSIVTDAVTIITILWNTFGSTLISYAKAAFQNIMQVVRGAFQIIAGIFKVVSSLLKGDWKGVWEGIKQIVKGAWNVISGLVKQGFNLVKTIFTIAGIAIKAVFSRLWDGVKTVAGNAWQGIKNLVSNGAQGIVNLIKSIPGKILGLAGAFMNAGKDLGGKIISGLGAGLSAVGGFMGDIASSVKSAINGALGLPVSINGPGPLPDFTIPAFAKGTSFAPGGMALVGERGPELVNLPRGSRVATAARTRAMAGRAGAGVGGAHGGSLRLVSGTLSLDESGQAFIRGIAAEEVDSAGEFAGTLARMG